MRFFGGVLASVIVFLTFGFFSTVANAQQNPCNPDSEIYDARACFEYVQTLEAKNTSAKRDLVLARRETSIVKSRLMVAEVRHTRSSNDLRWDIVSGAWKIRSLETTVKILSEEKEIAWGYVDVISKVLAAAILFGIVAGIVMMYLSRNRVADWDRYRIEARDEKIREFDARNMAVNDVKILRQEIFVAKADLAARTSALNKTTEQLLRARESFAQLMEFLARTSPLLRTSYVSLQRARMLVRGNGDSVRQNNVASSGATA